MDSTGSHRSVLCLGGRKGFWHLKVLTSIPIVLLLGSSLTRSSCGNKNERKPYNAADARHVDSPQFGGSGAPMVVDIGGVRQGVSELLQALYYLCKALRYLLQFLSQF